METSVQKAVRLLGGPIKAAERLRIRHYQTVQRWLRTGRLPAEYCPTIERELAGAVICEALCPDVDWSYLRGTTVRLPDSPNLALPFQEPAAQAG